MKATKKNMEILEKERDLLRLTLEHIINENKELTEINEDLKMTVKHNKEMLKEYVENITSKDKIVQKMNSLIDHLNERLVTANEYIRKLKMNNERCEIKSVGNCLRKVCNMTTITQTYNKSDNTNNDDLTSVYECRTVNDGYISNLNRKNNLTKCKKEISYVHNCVFCQTMINKSRDNLLAEIEKLNREIAEVKSSLGKRKYICHESTNNMRTLSDNQLFNLNHSILSKNTFTEMSPRNFRINLNENFDKTLKLKQFLSENDGDVVLLVDGNHNCWELLRRKDIKDFDYSILKNINSIQDSNKFGAENIVLSISPQNKVDKKKSKNNVTENNTSLLDISRITDFNNLSIFNNEDEILIC